MPLPKSWTTVTPLSKTIALILFAFLPAIAFFFGVRYQQKIDQPVISNKELSSNVTDSRAGIKETSDLTPFLYDIPEARFTLLYPNSKFHRIICNYDDLYLVPNIQKQFQPDVISKSCDTTNAVIVHEIYETPYVLKIDNTVYSSKTVYIGEDRAIKYLALPNKSLKKAQGREIIDIRARGYQHLFILRDSTYQKDFDDMISTLRFYEF